MTTQVLPPQPPLAKASFLPLPVIPAALWCGYRFPQAERLRSLSENRNKREPQELAVVPLQVSLSTQNFPDK